METIAIYPGSFDPPTLGHLSIIRRAVGLFDQVIVLVADNPAKEGWLPVDERVEMLREALAGLEDVRVEATDDLVVGFAAQFERENRRIVLLRGIRDQQDLQHELLLARANRQLSSGIETILLPAAESMEDVSSTRVRQRVEAGEDVGELVHPRTVARLRE
jgi:pantetheine-phosphate adenylyltransferase